MVVGHDGDSLTYHGWMLASGKADQNWTTDATSTRIGTETLILNGTPLPVVRVAYDEMQRAPDGIQFFHYNTTRWYRAADMTLVKSETRMTGHNRTQDVHDTYTTWRVCPTEPATLAVGAVNSGSCWTSAWHDNPPHWMNRTTSYYRKAFGQEQITVGAGTFTAWHITTDDTYVGSGLEKGSRWVADLPCAKETLIKTRGLNAEGELVAYHCA